MAGESSAAHTSGGTAVPPGNCPTHGYHGRTYCPRCSTSAIPPPPLGQAPSAASARYEFSFFVGPTSEEQAIALSDAILDLPEAKAVGAGAVGMQKLVCRCGTPTVVCSCGDERCPKCDPKGCPGANT